MEAGFYGDTGRVIGFLFYEVKQRRSRLVPGWVTAVLDFVEDQFHATLGWTTVTLVSCIGSALGFALWGVCDFGTKSREGGGEGGGAGGGRGGGRGRNVKE